MSKLLIVIETGEKYAPITHMQNLLTTMIVPQELPEGVELISNTAFLVEFPRCDLFFAKLLVVLDKVHYNYRLFEIAEPKQ